MRQVIYILFYAALLALVQCGNGTFNLNFTFDTDTDGDDVVDIVDFCQLGETNWKSNPNTDYDSDGCQDNSSEEIDTDNDTIPDRFDDCKKSAPGFSKYKRHRLRFRWL